MEYRCTDKVSVDDPVQEALDVPFANLPMDLLGYTAVSRPENSNGQVD